MIAQLRPSLTRYAPPRFSGVKTADEAIAIATREQVDILPSEFTEFGVYIPQGGQVRKFSFTSREYLKAIYNTPSKRVLLTCGRQTEKSTSLGNMILTYSIVIPFFRTLYVSPSHQQTKVFSRDRIKEGIELSPVIKSFTNQKLLSNILEKKFMNGSQITMRFAFLNADRVRGIPADAINIDEFQDVLLDNVPVIEECASHSPYKFFRYSGTPKSLDGSLEHYWSKFSTQNEWAVPCRRHGTPNNPGSWHWNVLDEDNIGKEGLVCDKCGKLIDPADPDAQWASLNPNPRVENPFEGYRIPQLMVPWIEWTDILHKQRSYSRAKFYNEVLGRSYDSGTRPLTRQDIIDNCMEKLSMRSYELIGDKYAGTCPIFLGTDWGSGENSYTVVVLGAYLPFAPDRFTFFYSHRFEGRESEPDFQIKRIIELARKFKVHTIGVDYGGGFWPNDELIRTFGAEKIKRYQWVGNVKKKLKYDSQLGVPRFLAHRTEVMSDYFNALKRRDVFCLPRWEEYEDPFASDHLNIFSEYSERLRMNVYKHMPGCPDDTAHANMFCFLASFFYRNRPDVISPKRELDESEAYSSKDDLDIEIA